MNKVPEREPWHMECEDRINLCGSYSKSTTPFERSVTCPKCKEILKIRKQSGNFFYRENDASRQNTCSCCGAAHGNSTLKITLFPGKQVVIFSLCSFCRELFKKKMKEFLG